MNCVGYELSVKYNFLCSFLIDMYSRFEFILFSVLLRVVEGIGTAGYSTALFTMATVLYPKSTGAVIVSERPCNSKYNYYGFCRVFLKLVLESDFPSDPL